MLSDSTVVKQGHSSLPFQVLIFFNWHFSLFFFFVGLCLYTFKASMYYYPSKYLGWEIVSIFLYIFIDYTRLLLASKGNKVSDSRAIIGSWLLAVPIVVLHAYYIELQTYVLRVDIVLNAIALFFVGTEVLLSIFVFVALIQSSKRF